MVHGGKRNGLRGRTAEDELEYYHVLCECLLRHVPVEMIIYGHDDESQTVISDKFCPLDILAIG